MKRKKPTAKCFDLELWAALILGARLDPRLILLLYESLTASLNLCTQNSSWKGSTWHRHATNSCTPVSKLIFLKSLFWEFAESFLCFPLSWQYFSSCLHAHLLAIHLSQQLHRRFLSSCPSKSSKASLNVIVIYFLHFNSSGWSTHVDTTHSRSLIYTHIAQNYREMVARAASWLP